MPALLHCGELPLPHGCHTHAGENSPLCHTAGRGQALHCTACCRAQHPCLYVELLRLGRHRAMLLPLLCCCCCGTPHDACRPVYSRQRPACATRSLQQRNTPTSADAPNPLSACRNSWHAKHTTRCSSRTTSMTSCRLASMFIPQLTCSYEHHEGTPGDCSLVPPRL